jgi:hypothetical protein
MPNTVVSPNMNITVPVVLTDPGPDWATRIYNALFATIDAHDHSSGKGVQITPLGMNINADLAFGSFNATGLRSARFTSQATPLALGGDVGCLSNVLGDAYWNNGAGTAIELTSQGMVGTSFSMIGRMPVGGNFGGLWSGNALVPGASNYAIISDGSTTTQVNAPSGGSLVLGAAGTGLIGLSSSLLNVFSGGWEVAPFTGSANTQQNINRVLPWRVNTSSTGATLFASYAIPNNSSATFIIEFNGRQTGTPANTAGGLQVFQVANSAGTLTITSAAATTATTGVNPFTSLSVTASGATAQLNVTAAAVASTDWQGFVTIINN